MKALTDRIIECLNDKRKGFIGNLKDEKTVAHSQGFRDGLDWAIETIETLERQADFEEIARIMMKHLGKRTDLYCPHHSVIITNSNAELVQTQYGTGNVEDYIPD
jgi:hypothetical protein